MSFEISPIQKAPVSVADSPAQRDPIRELSEVRRIWDAIWHRRRLFLTIFAAFVLGTTAISLMIPKTYTTSVTLIAGNRDTAPTGNDPTTQLPVLNALLMQSGVSTAETYAALIQQNSVAAKVAQNLNLNSSPAALLGRLNVKPIVNTAILDLSVRWRDPVSSARIANEFANVFVARERDFVSLQAQSAMKFLGSEIPRANDRMKAANDTLADFQSRHAIVGDMTAQTNDLVSRTTAIEAKMDAVQLDRRQAQAMLATVQGELSSSPATIVGTTGADANPTLSALRTQLAQVNVQLATARQQYTDAHPAVQSLKSQRDALLRQINAAPASVSGATTLTANPVVLQLRQQAAAYQSQAAGDDAQLRELTAQKSSYKPILKQLPNTATTLAYLEQKSKLATDVYNALQQKYNDAQIARTTAISDVTVLEPADASAAVVTPNVLLNMGIATVLGLILATIGVFLADFFEKAVRNEEDITRILGLPVIATIPEFARPGQRALPWIQSLSAEAFLHLCTSLRMRSKKPLRKIAITSPSKGDGKTTIAVHLAISMSKVRPGVLLLDADMRRPAVHGHFNASNDVGLSDVLSGNCTLADATRSVGPGLDIVTSGSPTDNPVGLLESPNFDALLKDALHTHSMVIIDAPALVPVTDSVIISAKSDATALVIGANATDERAVKIAASRLGSMGVNNLVGVILNRAETKISDYSDYFVRTAPPALGNGVHD